MIVTDDIWGTKQRLGKLGKKYSGPRLWRQPTNITGTSSSASRSPQRNYTPGTGPVYFKWRKHGAIWPKSWKPAAITPPQHQHHPEFGEPNGGDGDSVHPWLVFCPASHVTGGNDAIVSSCTLSCTIFGSIGDCTCPRSDCVGGALDDCYILQG